MNKKFNILLLAILLIFSLSFFQQFTSTPTNNIHLFAQEIKSANIKEIGGIKFVIIPGGSFMMGSSGNESEADEHPLHKVTLNGFWMSMYEVTQKQYQEIMGKNPSYFKGENLPVDQVTWDDAMEFCKKFGGKYKVKTRLPTEAEWEYACRAGTRTNYYWGNTMDGDYCWNGKNSGDRTHPIGEKKPNPWGLYDMAGNVWEWCLDWYNGRYYIISPEKNPQGPNLSYYRVLRGGGRSREFGHRSAGRSSSDPSDASDTNGFRVVIEE